MSIRKSGYSRTFRIALAFAIMVASTASAQFLYDPLVVYESFTENGVLPGGRAAGMGGAQIAAGTDGSVLWYNPALLTRIRHSEISGTLTHQMFSNETSLLGGVRQEADVSNTRLGSLWGIFPVQAYRGGLTLGISVNRIRSFDKVFRYASSNTWLNDPVGNDGWGGGEDENGSLWAWRLINPRLKASGSRSWSNTTRLIVRAILAAPLGWISTMPSVPISSHTSMSRV